GELLVPRPRLRDAFEFGRQRAPEHRLCPGWNELLARCEQGGGGLLLRPLGPLQHVLLLPRILQAPKARVAAEDIRAGLAEGQRALGEVAEAGRDRPRAAGASWAAGTNWRADICRNIETQIRQRHIGREILRDVASEAGLGEDVAESFDSIRHGLLLSY